MKFKLIFLLFNVITIISFLFIFFFPFWALGWEYTKTFWIENYLLVVGFMLVLVVLDIYFLKNWKLFQLLEQENWTELISHLEERIYQKGKVKRKEVGILVNTYLIKSDTAAISRLEDLLRQGKKSFLNNNVIPFGIPHLLKSDSEAMERYYAEFKDKKNIKERGWIVWSYAFALILQEKRQAAGTALLPLLGKKQDPILTLLSLYLLEGCAADHEAWKTAVEAGKEQLRRKYGRPRWDKEVQRSKNSVQVVVLSKLVQEATDWMFKTEMGVNLN